VTHMHALFESEVESKMTTGWPVFGSASSSASAAGGCSSAPVEGSC
jgi:hypothetical protein